MDRLRPRYRGGRPGDRGNERLARAIVRKYRRRTRNSQLELLQSLVPGVQGRQVGEVEVLEETTRYIQALETRLLDRLREQGLPARLAKMRGEGGEEGEEGERSEEEEEGDELLGLVHRTLGEEVAARWRSRGRRTQERRRDW